MELPRPRLALRLDSAYNQDRKVLCLACCVFKKICPEDLIQAMLNIDIALNFTLIMFSAWALLHSSPRIFLLPNIGGLACNIVSIVYTCAIKLKFWNWPAHKNFLDKHVKVWVFLRTLYLSIGNV
jgi:hypothetical protein